MPYNRIIVTSFVIILCLGAQDINEAIRLFNAYQFDRSREIFVEVVKDENNPRIAEAYYYLGRLALAPDSALAYYRHGIIHYPQSRYADVSHLEIAKIQIAREEFDNAILTLNELLRKYPETRAKDEVLFWLGVSYVSSGNKNEGGRVLNKLRTDYPKSVWSERALNIIPSGDTPSSGKEYFTIQVGSYKNKANAEKYAAELSEKGYDARIVEALIKGNTYFRVWIGKFAKIDDAKAFSLKLDSLGIKGNVVKGY